MPAAVVILLPKSKTKTLFMKSLFKSMRVAVEIFTPPLLFSIVLALQMARPAGPGKKTGSIHEGRSAVTRLSSLKHTIAAATPFQKPAHN
jgi:hypothetical protein